METLIHPFPRRRQPVIRPLRFVLLVAIGALGGCVRSYQPLSGLHVPRVVDPQRPNFRDVALSVHCVPSDYVSAPEAASLCRRVGALFENQGAAVQTYTHARGAGLDEDAALAQPEDGGLPMAARTELVLELRSRQVHKSKHPASWVLFAFSFTLLPGVTEQTFVQEVEIRDGEGFLLARDTLEGRLVRRVGAGTWAANKVLDWTVRPPEAELTGNAMQRDLSEDLYGRLSQLLFNARVQRQVLDERTREVR